MLSVSHRLHYFLVDTLKSSSVIEGTVADQGFALVLQMQHLKSTVMLSPSPHAWDLQLLQQQACPMVPREQFLQLQHQLLQAERINQFLQEELENRTSETNTPQVCFSSKSKLRIPDLILPVYLKLYQFKSGTREHKSSVRVTLYLYYKSTELQWLFCFVFVFLQCCF